MPEEVKRIVSEFYLLEFADCSLIMLDASLLLAFVDRWHSETTSFFYLPFGEMRMTLNDVDDLFYISIAGTFFTPVYRNHATAVCMVMEDFEVSELEVLYEFGETQGFHLS
ncbi:unnamed protein product [Vicia faba]|uniref:Aminotransferase-like plant mobile domain-containing protein n=1 Tax=Vicia faba TaxID=3906 RepID=A0AAV0Z647_VICFA|nr:unnamed protein product [Vicia faba]